MKTLLHILAFSLLTLPQSFAQYNTVYGTGAGTGGSRNTHLGYYAGRFSTGSWNTFLGFHSGYSNTSGYYNTFLGSSSGYSNTTGRDNTFVGRHSGVANTTGNDNTFLGHSSGRSNTTGILNTILGDEAGYRNQSGNGNVFIGHKAGYSETESDRFYIDNNDDSEPLLYGNFSTNVVSIGTKYTGTTYSLVVPGRVRATEYWISTSSGDVKVARQSNQTKAAIDALAKVQQVETVSYSFTEETINEDNQQKAKISKANEQSVLAFLPENLKELFPALVIEEEEEVAVNYQGMIPILVEAVKELSLQTSQKDQLIQTQQQELISLKQELAVIKEAIGLAGPSSLQGTDIPTGTLLEQNIPNPFDQVTTIRYQAPAQARQVSLLISNLQGIEVLRFDDLAPGSAQVEIAAGSLAIGTYVYTLLVDGKVVASQKMILTK